MFSGSVSMATGFSAVNVAGQIDGSAAKTANTKATAAADPMVSHGWRVVKFVSRDAMTRVLR